MIKSRGGGYNHWMGTAPQADPNGLFMPTSSSATWLMMIDEETKMARPVYFEPEIVVSPFPLHKMAREKVDTTIRVEEK